MDVQPRRNTTKKTSTRKAQTKPAAKDLHALLGQGLLAITKVWEYTAEDWVTSVHAEDIDDDGDIEVVLSARDGSVRALTRWGSVKWKTVLGISRGISSIIGIGASRSTASVIAGSRNGRVYALNQSGQVLWTYDTEMAIRQVYVPQQSTMLIVGSEDHFVHVLETATGQLLYKYPTEGLVRCVFAYDIDGDGQIEVLAGSADKKIHVIDEKGQPKGIIETEYEIYALNVITLQSEACPVLLTSSSGKDLCAWRVMTSMTTERENHRLLFQRYWLKTLYDDIFTNRILAITVADINNDGAPEIIVGSEDKHLYIFDQQGSLLWKHLFSYNVTSIYACDIDFDGVVEIIVGLESNIVHVLRAHVDKDLYTNILMLYKETTEVSSLLHTLTPVECNLLQDIVGDQTQEQPAHQLMELAHALHTMHQHRYEDALIALLRLQQQQVQHYWSRPKQTSGYIRGLTFGDIYGDSIDEILLATEDGTVQAAEFETNKILWSTKLGGQVYALHAGSPSLDEYNSIFAVQANGQLIVLDSTGAIQKWFTPPAKEDWLSCLFIHTPLFHEVIIGTENKKIYVYNSQLTNLLLTIETSQGIEVLCAYDLAGTDEQNIIAGTVDGCISVYNRQGQECWRYQIGSRIHALVVYDIDHDGRVEVIVGSEDRYVYVLDHQGHLKWRYLTPHHVLALDALDIDNDGYGEIILGNADGSVLVINHNGDLLWTYKTRGQIRAIRAKDINDDGYAEIIVGSEEILEALQVIDQQELSQHIQRCWEALLSLSDASNDALTPWLAHPNEDVRAFALQAFLQQSQTIEETLASAVYESALKDSAATVRIALVSSFAQLCRRATVQSKDLPHLRRFLQQFNADPDPACRIALINMFDTLARTDADLAFDSLERFTYNTDPWIRQAVVHTLYRLIITHPVQTFRLLLAALQDTHPWMREEAGRGIAFYLDHHRKTLLFTIYELLHHDIEPVLFQHIAFSVHDGLIQTGLLTLSHLLQALLDGEHVAIALDNMLNAFHATTTVEITSITDAQQVYQEFSNFLHIDSIEDVKQFELPDLYLSMSNVPLFLPVLLVLEELREVIRILQIYHQSSTSNDRIIALLNASTILADIHHNLQQNEKKQAFSPSLLEYRLLLCILQQWQTMVAGELRQWRGNAELHTELGKGESSDETINMVLTILNNGSATAYKVRVFLDASDDFEILGSNERYISEISIYESKHLLFMARPYQTEPRCVFTVVYDDVKKTNQRLQFADRLQIDVPLRKAFQLIPNPYNSGVPVRSTTMFFGRQKDLAVLREILMNTEENRVILLTGSRRIGKTSLLYQIVNDLQLVELHVPMLIDLQTAVLKEDVEHLLIYIADQIRMELLSRDIEVPLLEKSVFAADPTRAFDTYLETVIATLNGKHLILVLDECEALQQKIMEEFFSCLGSIIQHRQGIRLLLTHVGTRQIKRFFDNSMYTHTLPHINLQDVTDLIVEPVRGSLHYEDLAIEKIYSLTGGSLFLVNVVCEMLIKYCNEQRKSDVTLDDVKSNVLTIIENYSSSVSWIWHCVNPLERLLLSVMAQTGEKEDGTFSLMELEAIFDEFVLPFEQKKVREALKCLMEKDFIKEEWQYERRFSISAGLVRHWLQATKPPERVVREEQLHDIWLEQNRMYVSDASQRQALSLDPPASQGNTAFMLMHTMQRTPQKIYCLSWSTDGTLLASGYHDGSLELWNIQNQEAQHFTGHQTLVSCLTWSPDGTVLVSGDRNGILHLWYPHDQHQQLQTLGNQATKAVSCLAWSPAGTMLASGFIDGTIRLWDWLQGTLLNTLFWNEGAVTCIAWSPDGTKYTYFAAGYDDGTILLWKRGTDSEPQPLKGHVQAVTAIAWSPDGQRLVSVGLDTTMRIWNPETGLAKTIEGFAKALSSLSFSKDGQLLATRADIIHIWSTATWEIVATVDPLSKERYGMVAFHPRLPLIAATTGENDTITIWAVDVSALIHAVPVTPLTRHRNAKVILVGDSGVGKSALSLVLTGRSFAPTDSTHNRNVQLLERQECCGDTILSETREIHLWDLAGQPGYRLIHQLHLNQIAVALIVFDAHSETDPFAGVEYWDRALRQVERLQSTTIPDMKKILIAARIDCGGKAVSNERVHALMTRLGCLAFFETSAKENINIQPLLEKIKSTIDWDTLPEVILTELFQRIETFLATEKAAGHVLSTYYDLYRTFLATDPLLSTIEDIATQFERYIQLVEAKGTLRRFSLGNFVLLDPDLLDSYTAALINAARDEPDGLGHIPEALVKTAAFFIPGDVRLADTQKEALLLIATIEDLLRYEIVLREESNDGAYLVFPSQTTRENPAMPYPDGKAIIFRFEGAIQNIYATLAVRLSHSGLFKKKSLWKNAVIYETIAGGTYGIFLQNKDEGLAELTLFFDKDASEETRLHFEEYIKDHLHKHLKKHSLLERRRIFLCPSCGITLDDLHVRLRQQRGHDFLHCPVCDTKISLHDGKERLTSTYFSVVSEMNSIANEKRDQSTAASLLQAKRAAGHFDVFLCHNAQDKAEVKRIGEQLQARGILPWLDEWELPPGQLWQPLLEQQIGKIKAAAIFVSEHDISPWQKQELYALLIEFTNRGCPVIPVLLHNISEIPRLPLFLQRMTWVDFRSSEPDPMEQLLWGVTGQRGTKP